MKLIKNKKAVTLLEIMIYISIVVIALTIAIDFSLQVLKLSSASNSMNKIQAEINIVMQKIITQIQTAQRVIAAESKFSDLTGAIKLSYNSPFPSPANIYLENGKIYFTLGASTPIQLNSNEVIATQLMFKLISSPKAPDQIVIDAQFQSASAKNPKVFPIHLTVSLRK